MGPIDSLLERTAAWAVRRRRPVLGVAIVAAVVFAALALRLHPSAATSTFVSSSSGSYRATQGYYARFGEEPVVVLVQGDLQQMLLSADVNRLLGLEECLSGRMSAEALAHAGGPRGPCGQLARARTVKVVIGPATFLSQAARQTDLLLNEETAGAEAQARQAEAVIRQRALARGYGAARAGQLARQAGQLIVTRFQESVAALALQYGLTSRPSLDDPEFVSDVVFDSSKPAGTPKQRFAYLFPSRDSALVSVRMRGGLGDAQRTRTIALIRQAVTMNAFHLVHGESYLVTGVPVIVSDLTGSITHSLELLMLAVVLVMAAALGLLFTGARGALRLLPLALALLATALTFGTLSLAGASLTVASVAVLPVVVGLAVDYAIQFQSRVQEESEPAQPVRPFRAIEAAAAAGAPTLLVAATASAAAMLALLLSPVPMVRGFGALLIAGIALALACTLTVGAAALAMPRAPGVNARLAPGRLAAAWRGAGELLRENPLTRLVRTTALVTAVRRPWPLLGVGLLLAALGWGLDTQTHVETDITKLVPQTLASLQGLNQLERTSGVAGEIDLMVSGRNVTSPATIAWMSAYEQRMLARYGYSDKSRCAGARLCPAFSLPDLFKSPAGSSASVSAAQVQGLLAEIPPYLSQAVVTPDRRAATLAFGIRTMSLQQQQALIEGMRRRLHPPSGVSATLVGLPVLAAQSGTQVADPWRRLETLLVGLAAVALVLLALFRGDVRRALVPLAPVVLATGWSALVLFAVQVPLNPMSVTLGALVIAIATEFSVLLSERYRQELAAAAVHDPLAALARSYRRTGAAVAASGVSAIAGFGVLSLSDIRMLRDFGLVTLIDLTVSLLGVLVALPAVLVVMERGELATVGRRAGRRLALLGAARQHGRA